MVYHQAYAHWTEGRLWAGSNRVEFQEHGDGANPQHNFSATCGEISI